MLTKESQDAIYEYKISFHDSMANIDGNKPDDIWIKSWDHLERVNKYRKRVGQNPVVLSISNIAELTLLGDGK